MFLHSQLLKDVWTNSNKLGFQPLQERVPRDASSTSCLWTFPARGFATIVGLPDQQTEMDDLIMMGSRWLKLGYHTIAAKRQVEALAGAEGPKTRHWTTTGVLWVRPRKPAEAALRLLQLGNIKVKRSQSVSPNWNPLRKPRKSTAREAKEHETSTGMALTVEFDSLWLSWKKDLNQLFELIYTTGFVAHPVRSLHSLAPEDFKTCQIKISLWFRLETWTTRLQHWLMFPVQIEVWGI